MAAQVRGQPDPHELRHDAEQGSDLDPELAAADLVEHPEDAALLASAREASASPRRAARASTARRTRSVAPESVTSGSSILRKYEALGAKERRAYEQELGIVMHRARLREGRLIKA